jgi:hypothetical protein
MQAIVTTATPDQTSARRCVIVRAIQPPQPRLLWRRRLKSLMGMSKPSFNTNRHEHANAAMAS